MIELKAMNLLPSDRRYTCEQVFDQETRSIRDAWEVLDKEYEAEQFQLRMKAEEDKQSKGFRFTCPLCDRGLNLRGGGDQKKTLHFTHPREPEHKCPYKTADNHSPEDIEAMKYNGAKESIEHQLVKKRLISGLHLDPDTEPGSVKSEETFRANLPDKSWRRPDVSVRWKGLGIVFEAQLSTTFLSVIAGRRTFYCQNQAQLIWVFAQAPDSADMPFTHKDIFHNNNHNLFVVNSATEEESLTRRCLILEAWWPDPLQYLRHKTATHWHRKMVALHELTFDQPNKAVYFYDFEKELNKLSDLKKSHNIEPKPLSTKHKFIHMLITHYEATKNTNGLKQISNLDDDSCTQLEEMAKSIANTDSVRLRNLMFAWISDGTKISNGLVLDTFEMSGFVEPATNTISSWDRSDHFRAIAKALFSIAIGIPQGMRLKNLKEVENWMFSRHRCHYVLFLNAIKFFKRDAVAGLGDPQSAIQKHIELLRQDRKTQASSSDLIWQERGLDDAILLFFPELKDVIISIAKKQKALSES